MERRPHESRPRVGHLDHLHQVGGDRGVQPGDDVLVDLEPFSVVPHGLRIDGAIDMVEDSELAKGSIEEGALEGECRVAVVEDDGNMGANVHVLAGGRGYSGGRWLSKGIGVRDGQEDGLDAMGWQRKV